MRKAQNYLHNSSHLPRVCIREDNSRRRSCPAVCFGTTRGHRGSSPPRIRQFLRKRKAIISWIWICGRELPCSPVSQFTSNVAYIVKWQKKLEKSTTNLSIQSCSNHFCLNRNGMKLSTLPAHSSQV